MRATYSGHLLAARQAVPPLAYSHASGSWVYASDGRRYLDASSGLVCVNIGHAHPRIVRALTEQAALGSFASPGMLAPSLQETYARAVARAVQRPADMVALTCTGTSAVEMAVALARLAQRGRGGQRRHKVLTASLSYHGNSAYTLALSGHRRRRPHPDDGFGQAPAFDPPYPGLHRDCRFSTCRADCAEAVQAAIDEAGVESVAAVLIEPVNGTTGGGYVPPPDYLAAVADICSRRGVLVIHDEVLTGLGRTGLPLAAHHAPGSDADLTVLSKGLGAGYLPMGAVLVRPELAEVILTGTRPAPMMGTMSATPLQAAVGLEVLSVLEEIGALDRQRPRGAELESTVRAAAANLPVVREVRGVGWFFGIELEIGDVARALSVGRDNGLLLYPFNGFRPDGGGAGVIVAPPLTASPAEIEVLGIALRATLERLSDSVVDALPHTGAKD